MADVTVRLTSGVFDDGGTLRRGGEEFEVGEATAGEHPELKRVSDDESGGPDGPNDSSGSEDASDDGGEGTTDPPFDPGEYTVEELRARMADSDHSDAEREALADAERDGENRDSALDVLGA